VRVRPPLRRELPHTGDRDELGNPVQFQEVTLISEDAKKCTLLEYIGHENSEGLRQRDMRKNPHLVSQHTFGFDQIYGPEST
jgi:hypothetical protein